MFAPFHYAFVQRGMLEALLLSIPAGILGTWIVLRGLAFFSHAVGTAAFPGLVLASDVFHSGANVETLLFGSLLLVGSSDVRLAAIAAAVTVLLSATLGRRWLAVGFERETASGPEASRFDPHWWHDPRNAEAAVRAIRATLVALDPSHRTGYRRRAAAYLAKLRALDRSLAACFARLPRSERKLVTDHDAFGYFTHRYGLDVVGAVIPSQTTQAQPSAGATARLVRLIRREHVRAVFPESSVNPRLPGPIARGTGATSRYTLYGDTLGPAGSPGATYLGMERANADAIVRGLSGGRLRGAP